MIGLRTYAACHEIAANNVGLFAAAAAFLAISGLAAAIAMLVERHRQERRFAEMRDVASEAVEIAEHATINYERLARMVSA